MSSSFKPCFLAMSMTISTVEKSKQPSSGSISSQLRVAMTLFIPSSTAFRQLASMASGVDEFELCSSPASMTKGWSSTIKTFVLPCCFRYGLRMAKLLLIDPYKYFLSSAAPDARRLKDGFCRNTWPRTGTAQPRRDAKSHKLLLPARTSRFIISAYSGLSSKAFSFLRTRSLCFYSPAPCATSFQKFRIVSLE